MSKKNEASSPENPLAVARDRFQASAREIIRNIEKAIGSTHAETNSEGSLEQAFRSFFSSCTTGATMATTDDDHSQTAANATPISFQPSQDSTLSSKPRRLSLPVTKREAISTKESLRRLAESRKDYAANEHLPSTQPPASDHIYEHLMFSEELSRSAAANRIPEELPTNRRRRSPLGISPNIQPKKRVTPLTKPFPVSSPTREKPVVTPLHSAERIMIPQSLTFDDGISAISAHTLEAMAKEPPAELHSTESSEKMRVIRVTTQFPRTTIPLASAKLIKENAREQVRDPFSEIISRPVPFSRPTTLPHDTSPLNVSSVNSSFTKNSRSGTPVRHGTPHSRSTRTTQSSRSNKSFEHWQTTEQQFWESLVVQDETSKPKRRNSSKGRRSRTFDSTLSTASSTAQNSRSSSWWETKHPHETLPFDPSDLFFTPDYPDTETAEI